MTEKSDSSDLEILEGELANRLRMYRPRTDYVDLLKKRLVKPSGVEVESNKWKPAVLFLSLGIVGFIFATVALLRYIWSFFLTDDSAEENGS